MPTNQANEVDLTAIGEMLPGEWKETQLPDHMLTVIKTAHALHQVVIIGHVAEEGKVYLKAVPEYVEPD